jgi:hypothetical protein
MPRGLVLHNGDIDECEQSWLEAVPMTSPPRTLRDCIDAHVSPDPVQQAIGQARHRGLISRDDETKLTELLEIKSQGAR